MPAPKRTLQTAIETAHKDFTYKLFTNKVRIVEIFNEIMRQYAPNSNLVIDAGELKKIITQLEELRKPEFNFTALKEELLSMAKQMQNTGVSGHYDLHLRSQELLTKLDDAELSDDEVKVLEELVNEYYKIKFRACENAIKDRIDAMQNNLEQYDVRLMALITQYSLIFTDLLLIDVGDSVIYNKLNEIAPQIKLPGIVGSFLNFVVEKTAVGARGSDALVAASMDQLERLNKAVNSCKKLACNDTASNTPAAIVVTRKQSDVEKDLNRILFSNSGTIRKAITVVDLAKEVLSDTSNAPIQSILTVDTGSSPMKFLRVLTYQAANEWSRILPTVIDALEKAITVENASQEFVEIKTNMQKLVQEHEKLAKDLQDLVENSTEENNRLKAITEEITECDRKIAAIDTEKVKKLAALNKKSQHLQQDERDNALKNEITVDMATKEKKLDEQISNCKQNIDVAKKKLEAFNSKTKTPETIDIAGPVKAIKKKDAKQGAALAKKIAEQKQEEKYKLCRKDKAFMDLLEKKMRIRIRASDEDIDTYLKLYSKENDVKAKIDLIAARDKKIDDEQQALEKSIADTISKNFGDKLLLRKIFDNNPKYKQQVKYWLEDNRTAGFFRNLIVSDGDIDDFIAASDIARQKMQEVNEKEKENAVTTAEETKKSLQKELDGFIHQLKNLQLAEYVSKVKEIETVSDAQKSLILEEKKTKQDEENRLLEGKNNSQFKKNSIDLNKRYAAFVQNVVAEINKAQELALKSDDKDTLLLSLGIMLTALTDRMGKIAKGCNTLPDLIKALESNVNATRSMDVISMNQKLSPIADGLNILLKGLVGLPVDKLRLWTNAFDASKENKDVAVVAAKQLPDEKPAAPALAPTPSQQSTSLFLAFINKIIEIITKEFSYILFLAKPVVPAIEASQQQSEAADQTISRDHVPPPAPARPSITYAAELNKDKEKLSTSTSENQDGQGFKPS